MRYLIVGGFSTEGKVNLIQYLLTREAADPGLKVLTVIVNEIDAQLVSSPDIDSDTIRFLELKGGCPCCTLEGELDRALRDPFVVGSHCVIVEVSGSCDIGHLAQNLGRSDSSADVSSYCVVEVSSFKPLLEIVPVLKRNVEFCDAVALLGGTHDEEERMAGARQLLEGLVSGPLTDRVIPCDPELYIVEKKQNASR